MANRKISSFPQKNELNDIDQLYVVQNDPTVGDYRLSGAALKASMARGADIINATDTQSINLSTYPNDLVIIIRGNRTIQINCNGALQRGRRLFIFNASDQNPDTVIVDSFTYTLNPSDHLEFISDGTTMDLIHTTQSERYEHIDLTNADESLDLSGLFSSDPGYTENYVWKDGTSHSINFNAGSWDNKFIIIENTDDRIPGADFFGNIAFIRAGKLKVKVKDSDTLIIMEIPPVHAELWQFGNVVSEAGSPIPFNRVYSDAYSGHNTNNGQFTAPVSGRYQIHLVAAITDNPANAVYDYRLHVNGIDRMKLCDTDSKYTTVSATLNLRRNDYITINANPQRTIQGGNQFGHETAPTRLFVDQI